VGAVLELDPLPKFSPLAGRQSIGALFPLPCMKGRLGWVIKELGPLQPPLRGGGA